MTAATITRALQLDDYDLPRFVAKSVDDGDITKAELGEFLNRRVMTKRRDGETFPQAYARLLVSKDDLAGADLFLKYRGMPGLDEHQAATVRALSEPTASANENGGSALQQLEAMGNVIRETQPHLSREQAFAKALETPQGMALFRADKSWRLGVC